MEYFGQHWRRVDASFLSNLRCSSRLKGYLGVSSTIAWCQTGIAIVKMGVGSKSLTIKAVGIVFAVS